MAKTFITAHIKLDDELWQRLGGYARNRDLTTAQLIRKILTNWIDDQVYARVDADGSHHTLAEVRLENKLAEAFRAGWWGFYEANHTTKGTYGSCSTPSMEAFDRFMRSLTPADDDVTVEA